MVYSRGDVFDITQCSVILKRFMVMFTAINVVQVSLSVEKLRRAYFIVVILYLLLRKILGALGIILTWCEATKDVIDLVKESFNMPNYAKLYKEVWRLTYCNRLPLSLTALLISDNKWFWDGFPTRTRQRNNIIYIRILWLQFYPTGVSTKLNSIYSRPNITNTDTNRQIPKLVLSLCWVCGKL